MFKYAPKYRPPSFCTVPSGWRYVEIGPRDHVPNRPELPRSTHPFGVIEYDRQLTDDEVQVRAAYIDFLEARKQKKIMEKLHEKKKSEFVEQVRKLEQKSNDELYTTRHQLEKVLQLLDGGMDSNE
jgi:hypothetical protein